MQWSRILLLSLIGILAMVPTAIGASGATAPTKSLYQAAAEGDLAEMELHIRSRADLNAADAEGLTPLAVAASGGHIDVVKAMLEAGANVNLTSRQGTPLYVASRSGQLDMVRLLLESHANIHETDPAAGTALHAAAAMGHREVVELLLEQGADAGARTRAGLAPADLAEALRWSEIAELLRQRQTATAGRQGRPDTAMMERGPYDAGMPQERGFETRDMYGQPANRSDVLSDPDAIRQKVASFSGLQETLAALEEKSAGEQRGWKQRRIDNRTTLLRAVDTQFGEEMAAVKSTAQKENATKTLAAIDELQARRQERSDAIAEVLREERRAAVLAEREAAQAARGGRATVRGRGRVAEPTGATTPGPLYLEPTGGDPDAPALDPETQALLQAWQGAAEDKRPVLDLATETDLSELSALREAAAGEGAEQTAAAIEGIMLARQERRDNIFEQMAADEERQQRLQERLDARGATQGDAATQGGRRLR